MRLSIILSVLLLVLSANMALGQATAEDTAMSAKAVQKKEGLVAGEVIVSVSPEGSLEYYFRSGSSEGKGQHPAMFSLNQSGIYPADWSEKKIFKIVDKDGEVEATVIAAADLKYSQVLLKNLEPGQSIQVAYIAPPVNIPMPKEEFLEKLRIALLAQAVAIACNPASRPTQVSVKAGFKAGIGLIVGAEGNLELELTWNTADICPS